jgi:hypothetical protein
LFGGAWFRHRIASFSSSDPTKFERQIGKLVAFIAEGHASQAVADKLRVGDGNDERIDGHVGAPPRGAQQLSRAHPRPRVDRIDLDAFAPKARSRR